MAGLFQQLDHRIALYGLARPGVLEHFMGRKDF
jgi:hypothetical protein